MVARATDVRQRGESVEWRCTVCDGWSELARPDCGVCGAPRRGFAIGEDERGYTSGSPVGSVVAAVLVPGLGHILLGRVGSGIARLLIAALWGSGGLAWAFGTQPGARAPGIVLLLGLGGLWVTSVVDVVGLVGARPREAVGNRGLLWIVVGVTVLLAATATMATFGAAGG